MKIEEWKRRLPLDLKGVRLLGAALFLRASRYKEQSRRALEHRRTATRPSNPWKEIEWDRFDIEHYEREFHRWDIQHRDLEVALEVMGFSNDDLEKSKTLRTKDFQFRWDHLKDYSLLVAFITDEQPNFAKRWDRETPIYELLEVSPIDELTEIFHSEYNRVTGPDPDHLPHMHLPEHFMSYLLTWKLCEPETRKGHPSGRRWNDGLHNAVSYAYSLRSDAMEGGSPITNEEAIRRSLESFQIVDSDEFKSVQDKEGVVVSNGGFEGAVKAVRRKLSEADKEEASGNY